MPVQKNGIVRRNLHLVEVYILVVKRKMVMGFGG
jgi:hypothetical protein